MVTNVEGAKAISRRTKYFNSFIIASALFTGSISSSALAPIYPIEAGAKGIPASQFGFVFGVFQLVYIFSSPLYGIYAKTIRPTLMFKIGSFVLALCTIAFGFLNRLPSATLFLAMSIVIRAIGGLADCAIVVPAFTLIISYNPTDAAIGVNIAESAFLVGKLLGPTIGILLYQVHGFSLPFYIIGGVLMVLSLISIFCLKDFSVDTVENSNDGPKVLKVIQNPRVIITSFAIFAASTVSGFIQSLLEDALRSLNISQSRTGYFFMAMTGAYIVSAFCFGRLANKMGKFKMVIIVGFLIAATGLVLLGRVSFMPVQMTVGIVATSLVLRGTGYGCVLINCFMELKENIAGDGPKNEATNAFISGWYSFILSFGYFIGPTVGGPLYDLIGFSFTCLVMLGLDILAIISISVVVLRNGIQSQRKHKTMNCFKCC